MVAEREFGEYRPVAWIGRVPVYTSTVLAAVHVVAMVLTAIAMGFGAERLLQALVFNSAATLQDWSVWRFFTYAFVHEPPYLFFLVEVYLLATLGPEIEKHLGRAAFLRLYLVLLVLPPLVLTLAGGLGFPSVYAGSGALHFGVFTAFAVLYPRAEIFFSFQARWVVGVLFAVNALQCIALADRVGLGVLVVDCGAALALSYRMKFGRLLPAWRPVPPRVTPARPVARRDTPVSIDPILDKISRSGLASLTAEERRQLERARAELIAREHGG